MALPLTVIVLFLFLFLIILYYLVPILVRYRRLQKDYRNITFLPLSAIPFVGNLHQLDPRPHIFFQLICQLSKESQDQGKGLFCLWYTLWPMVFLCSGQGLEVSILNSFIEKTHSSRFSGIY